MEIRVADKAGFCFGVNRAVNIVRKLAEEGKSVSTLGPIIHNKQVVDELANMGVNVVDSPEKLENNRTLVIRSHGVGADVYGFLKKNNINYVDATCPFVHRIHKIVEEQTRFGANVIIAGDDNHPEVIGIKGFCSKTPFVVKNAVELQQIISQNPDLTDKNVCLVAQTTFDVEEWKKIIKISEKLCTNSIFFGTICNATSQRQVGAFELAKSSDIMIVIGGRHSSNTNKLYDICAKECGRTYLIETADELNNISFSEDDCIGITAGASTPVEIIKEVLDIMSEKSGIVVENESGESFEQLFEESWANETNDKVFGVVESIEPVAVYVTIDGRKQTGFIPINELSVDPNAKPEDVVKIGDKVELLIMKTNDQDGMIMCSKKRIDSNKGWDVLVQAEESKEILKGVVTEVVKGGVIVVCNATRVFIPGSLTFVSRKDGLESILHKEVEFRIIELDKKKKRAVGSIKSVQSERLRAERAAKREEFWNNIEVGQTFTGKVKSIKDYGAFVDIGGVDGLVYKSELSWSKIKHPSEVVKVGDEIEVFVKKIGFDKEKNKKFVSLGHKRPEDDPWVKFVATHKVGDVVDATIESFTDFGAFAVIDPDIKKRGLIHISQIANHRVENIEDELKIGQKVQAKITEIVDDEGKKRISLSIRAVLNDKKNQDQVVASASTPEEE